MNQYHHTTRPDSNKQRSGFTLTEMLVATALVVLIMLMFAQIYGSAVGSITEQRGLANNDQKARSVVTTLRKDLQALTYRQPSFPYGDLQGIVPIDNGDQPIIDPVNQRGYFFIAENSDTNDTDDILQFTIQLKRGQRGDQDDRGRSNRFIGKAANLGITNEAEKDDGISGNDLGASSAAEVCYFLRGGNLYRRLLLLRDPIHSAIREDGQPTIGVGRTRRFRTPSNPDYTASNFYTDFDYSATRRDDVLWFHSVDSLANDRGVSNWPIALPKNRFGFRANGASFENDSNGVYFGRFTHAETSDPNFGYPGIQPTTANDPYQRGDLTDSDGDYVIDQLSNGSRFGEDIILTHVEAFNVEVYDFDTDTFLDLPSNDTYDTFHPNASGTVPTEYFIDTSSLGTWAATSSSPPSVLGVPVLSQNSPVRRSMIYRRTSTGGTTGDVKPEFPPIPGTIIQDGTVTWECIDNRKPLKAIRVTLRFRDTRSGLVRQLSVIHSFVE
ncbi:PulJ/GspJ family protein [Thalassoglobus sp.]|uniref:PulJ/GspJ family protein n=1 Tax=Thalassoglobus sp. TaxID=2795869 RepID=UPI003AA88C61